MASTKVLLMSSKKKKDGTCPIAIRIIKDRKPKYVFLGVYIIPEQWDDTISKVRKSHPNAARINNLILKKLSMVDDILLEADANNKVISALQVKKTLKRDGQAVTFFQFAKEIIHDKRQQGKINVANSDQSRLNNLRKFQKNEDLFFTDITPTLLEKFQVHLKVKNEASTRTIMNHLLFVRTLFNKAIRDGIVDSKYYPFAGDKIKIKMPESMKIGLTEEEVTKIAELDLSPFPGKLHARNVWLFSFYFAGMRISDVLKTRWSDFQQGRLYYRMGKNEKVLSIAVPEKITTILAQYEPQKRHKDDFVFPDLKPANFKNPKDVFDKINTACARFNKHLTRIAKLAGVEKKISNHIARHTFGNIAGDKISPQMLQKLYRHTDIKTTMGYQANFIHKNADEALEQVINF